MQISCPNNHFFPPMWGKKLLLLGFKSHESYVILWIINYLDVDRVFPVKMIFNIAMEANVCVRTVYRVLEKTRPLGVIKKNTRQYDFTQFLQQLEIN
jgi:hypothetical protein